MLDDFRERLKAETQALESQGLLKRERIIGSAQGAVVQLADGREMINLCANNYLGLANHPAVVQAAHDALSRYGYGVASVRFICGTQSVHRELDDRSLRRSNDALALQQPRRLERLRLGLESFTNIVEHPGPSYLEVDGKGAIIAPCRLEI